MSPDNYDNPKKIIDTEKSKKAHDLAVKMRQSNTKFHEKLLKISQ